MTGIRDQGSKETWKRRLLPGIHRAPDSDDCGCPKTFRLVDEKAQRQRITDLEKRCDALEEKLSRLFHVNQCP